MTDTLLGVSPPPLLAAGGDAEDRDLSPTELARCRILVYQARQAGMALTGPDRLLKVMTKTMIEAAFEEEMADHLGYDKHAVEAGTGPTHATGSDRRRC